MNKEFTKILNGLLIDPFLKKITNVKVKNDLKDFYRHLDCNMVEVVSFGDVNDLWVDEKGLLKRDQRFFKVHNLPFGHHGVIAGKALMLRCGDNGGTDDCTHDIHEVTPRISWDFEHNGKLYNSETGLFNHFEIIGNSIVKTIDKPRDIVDSIKYIHVIE